MSEKVFEWATDHWKNSQCNRFRVKCGGKPQTRTLPVVWSDFLLPWSYCWSITSSSVQVTSLKKSNKSYRDVRQNFLSWDMIHPKGDTPVITEHDYMIQNGNYCLISLVLHLETLVIECSFPWYEFKNIDLYSKKKENCTIFGLKKNPEKFMNSYIA